MTDIRDIEGNAPDKVKTPAENPENTHDSPTTHKPWWRRALKITAWVVGSLIGLLVILMCLVAWILTPERLTPLVEKYGSQYLNADVKVKRVELTVWSSFPEIRLDITDLDLTSRTLQGQPDSVMRVLGADAAELLSVHSFSGSINPWKLLGGTIALGDIKADGLSLNVVSYSENINNYNILPPSEEDEEESSPWEIRFGEIDIKADGGVRYFDAQSGVDVLLASTALHISPRDTDCKRLDTSLKGKLTFKMEGDTYINNWPLDVHGPIDWDINTMDISLPDYYLGLSIFSGKLHTSLSLGERMMLKSCSLDIDPIPLQPIINNLPAELLDEYPQAKGIDTDLALALKADVACPWAFDAPSLPDVKVSLNVPAGRLSLSEDDHTLLDLSQLALQAELSYLGSDPAMSSLRIPMLDLKGEGMSLTIEAAIEELLADNPLIRVLSRGTLDLDALAALIPYANSTLGGTVQADAEVKGRLDDMMELRYENIEVDGSLQIRDLVCDIPQLATSLYSRLASFRFGNAINDMGPRVPGTLLAHADIDTLHLAVTGIEMGMSGASLKAGAKDDLLARKSDKEITPMGMSFTASRFRMDSKADTTKVRASDLVANGSLTRYEGNAESPLLKADLSASKLLYADPTMRLRMKHLSSDLSAHLRKRKGKGQNKGKRQDTRQTIVMKPEVDEGVKSLFKTWGISGNLASDKLRLTHLMYPVPVNITDLDLDFSLDSLRLHKAQVHTQDNDMTLSGSISNLRQFMLGRTRKPLKLRLNADISNIDINQMAFNFMLGSAMESQRGRLARLSEEEQDAIVKAAASIDTVESQATDTIPLTIPRNIDAIFKLKADKALYGDINLYRMRTDLIVNDGAASIDSLQASTDFGDAYLNLLYSSRNPELLNMAVDLGFSNINLQSLFHTFPTITEMAPAISDLSGMVGAKLVGSFDMYPDMTIDLNSMNAVLNLTGTNLELQQSPLIRKVARMMLIRKKGPLQIADMNIQVALHDNVLRLYPFKFGMEKYRFALLGQNDLAENMYYHLSVLKSPIPFRFGINIKGTFDKPKIRFGGPKYKENEAQEMINLVENQRVNFVKAMRLQLHKLVNKAAVTYADRSDLSSYGLDKEMKSADSGQDDDSHFSSPIEMLGNSLKTPAIKALGNSSNTLREFSEKYGIGQEKQADTDPKKKKQK